MISIKDKTKCCGCNACKSVCPKECITMKPDEEGFLYPSVNIAECINCGACDEICPITNHKPLNQNKPEAFVIRTKNINDLIKSTSGGFSTPIANWVFKNKGKVWTATYDENLNVVHREFDKDSKDFEQTRGSKYVQSDLNSSFIKIKKELENDQLVCFIGTTCQVYGLKYFLKKDYDNLFTVDLVCHGTPSPKLWRKYLDYQQNYYNSKIIDINFRNKTYGYHSGTMMLQFENGKTYKGSARVDYMLKSFFSEISSRPSCYSCEFKQIERISDFTIFDCWHMSELVENIKDDDKGYTNLLIHSQKGKDLFNAIKDEYDVYKVNLEKAIELDGIMVCNSAIPHPKRNEFYSDIDEHDLSAHIQKYIKVTKFDYIIEASKTMAYRLGLMDFLRKLKR